MKQEEHRTYEAKSAQSPVWVAEKNKKTCETGRQEENNNRLSLFSLMRMKTQGSEWR